MSDVLLLLLIVLVPLLSNATLLLMLYAFLVYLCCCGVGLCWFWWCVCVHNLCIYDHVVGIVVDVTIVLCGCVFVLLCG